MNTYEYHIHILYIHHIAKKYDIQHVYFVTPVSSSINISNHQRHGLTMAREHNARIYCAIPRHLIFGGYDLEVSGNRSLNEWQWANFTSSSWEVR